MNGIRLDDAGDPWDDDRWLRVLDRMPDQALFAMDPDGVIRRWNTGAETVFGWKAPAIVGRSTEALFTERDAADGVPKRELAAAREFGSCCDERWHRRADGSLRFVFGAVDAIRDPAGELRGFVKTVRDETWRKELEDRLASYRQRLEFAQGASSLGTFEWNIANDEEIWTDSMYQLYRIPPGRRLSYADWLRCVHPDDRVATERAFANAIAFHEPIDCMYRIMVPDGIRWIACRAAAVYDAAGRALSVVGTQTDITAQQEAQEALEGANRDLEQFASIASHDMQEPLRMIAGFLGLLRRTRSASLDEKARSWVDAAVDGAERMQRMIGSLLEFARIDSGALDRQPVDTARLVAQAAHDLGDRFEQAGATLEVRDLPIVRGDRAHLARLFLNLIGNAVKYRRRDVRPVIVVQAQRRDHEWQFSVADNGLGIPPDQRERLFGLFQRLHGGKDAPTGSGIGLAVCRKIVETHGGRIWVDAVPTGGSVFSFTLPADGEQPRAPGPRHAEREPAEREHVDR